MTPTKDEFLKWLVTHRSPPSYETVYAYLCPAPAPLSEEEIEKAADAALEKDHYENGEQGFLQRPYDRYRYHNGFTAGYRAALSHKQVPQDVLDENKRLREALESISNLALGGLDMCTTKFNAMVTDRALKTARQALGAGGEV